MTRKQVPGDVHHDGDQDCDKGRHANKYRTVLRGQRTRWATGALGHSGKPSQSERCCAIQVGRVSGFELVTMFAFRVCRVGTPVIRHVGKWQIADRWYVVILVGD